MDNLIDDDMKKKYIVLCVLWSIFFPLIFQGIFDTVFKDLFNPPGKLILLLHLRIISTILCFLITYIVGIYILKKGCTKMWLYVAHAILTFLWCGFWEIVIMP